MLFNCPRLIVNVFDDIASLTGLNCNLSIRYSSLASHIVVRKLQSRYTVRLKASSLLLIFAKSIKSLES